jgi:hypothetical protein
MGRKRVEQKEKICGFYKYCVFGICIWEVNEEGVMAFTVMVLHRGAERLGLEL